MSKETMKQVQQAREKVRKAKIELAEAMRSTFPAGTQATYSHGSYDVPCTVLEVLYGADVMVRGDSGKKYRIDGYRLRLFT